MEIDEAVAYASVLQEDYDREVAERDRGVVSKPYIRELVASRNRAVDPIRCAKMRLCLDAVLAESYHCEAGHAVLLYPWTDGIVELKKEHSLPYAHR